MGFLDNSGLTTLWSKITDKISSMLSAQAGKMIPYGYCQTAKATVGKTVTVSPAVTELTTGLNILVRFQYENTASNPTLSVNGLTAKAIKRYGSTAPSTSAASSWNAGAVCSLTYNGSYWMLNDWNNTTYSSMTEAEITAGTGTTARVITPARLKTAIETWSTGGTEVDPVFTASPAYGITSTDITNWNGKFNGIVYAYVRSNQTELSENWLSTNSAGTNVITPDTSTIYILISGSPNYIAGEALVWDGTSYQRLTRQHTVDWQESDYTSPSYIANKPTLLEVLYEGTTSITPTQVSSHIGDPMRITYVIDVDNYIWFTSFTEVSPLGLITSSAIAPINGTLSIAYLIGNLANDTWSFSYGAIPTKTSDLTNDSGFLTSYTETDPTVPSWAKASTKPSYDADEISFDNTQQVSYISNSDVNGALTDLDSAIDRLEHDVSDISSAYFPKSGGTITGDTTLEGTGKVLNLKSAVATNSPILRFQRGELNDNYNDWQIQDRSGFLYFDERGNGSTAWTNRVCFNTSGNVQATSFNNYTLAGACAKAVDTSISAGSTSTNLPTSQAVASFVEGKGYLEPFKVTLSYNGQTGEYSVDKTYAQIDSAITAGKYVYIYDATYSVSTTYQGTTIVAPLSCASPQDYWHEFRTIVEGANNTIEVRYSLADDGVYVDTTEVAQAYRTLPLVSSSDNGKVLRVVNGAWSAVSLPSASGVSF